MIQGSSTTGQGVGFMSGTLWTDHHVDYAGRAKADAEAGWTPRKRLAYFLIFATLAWSLVLTPFLLMG